MKHAGSSLVQLGIGLLLIVFAVQLLWSFIQQFAGAIVILFLIGGGIALYRIYSKTKGGDDDLLI